MTTWLELGKAFGQWALVLAAGWVIFTRYVWPWFERRDNWSMSQFEIAQSRVETAQQRLHEIATGCIDQMKSQGEAFRQIRDGLERIYAKLDKVHDGVDRIGKS